VARAGRALAAFVCGVLVVVVPGPPAGAVDGVSIDQHPIVVTAEQGSATVSVSWSGAVPGKVVFIDICRKSIGDPTFRPSRDCSALGQSTPNGTADGSGTATHEVFRGQDPAGERWGCYAADDTPPPGVTKLTTCFVRVTDTSLFNNDADTEVPFAFEGPGRVDPGAGENDGGAAAAAPTLPAAVDGAAVPVAPIAAPPLAPTGEPAPGESIMVASSAAGSGVSITG